MQFIQRTFNHATLPRLNCVFRLGAGRGGSSSASGLSPNQSDCFSLKAFGLAEAPDWLSSSGTVQMAAAANGTWSSLTVLNSGGVIIRDRLRGPARVAPWTTAGGKGPSMAPPPEAGVDGEWESLDGEPAETLPIPATSMLARRLILRTAGGGGLEAEGEVTSSGTFTWSCPVER